MTDSTHIQSNTDFTQNTIEAAIRLGLLLLLAAWCFRIVYPFIEPVMWGVIIAVPEYYFYVALMALLILVNGSMGRVPGSPRSTSCA